MPTRPLPTVSRCPAGACAVVVALLIATIAVLAGQGVALADVSPPGDIPDNQAFVTYRGAGFSLKTPEGWVRTGSRSSVTFADKYNRIAVEIRAAAAPTIASATHQQVPQLAKTVKGFAAGTVTSVARASGRAILITYRATSAPSAVTGKRVVNDVERYEFWRGGKLATLTLQAPHGSDNVDPWKLVTDSFRWTT